MSTDIETKLMGPLFASQKTGAVLLQELQSPMPQSSYNYSSVASPKEVDLSINNTPVPYF